jgi:predicted Zn finger-like uncharacterized protein
MYTQCPYCNTLFRVRVEQLRTARGQAHCSRCDNIFNALENLQDTAEKEEWPSSLFIDSTAPPPTDSPEQSVEQDKPGAVEEPQSSTHREFDNILDFSSDPFPESGNIDLDLGEIEPELKGIEAGFGETPSNLSTTDSSRDEPEEGLEETDSNLVELESELEDLESELEDLVSELDELEAESEQHTPLPEEQEPHHFEFQTDFESEASSEESEVGESTDIRLEKLASQLGYSESQPEGDGEEIEDLVSELDELEAKSEYYLPQEEEPVPPQQEFESAYQVEALTEEPHETTPTEMEVGESTEARLEDLVSQLEELEPQASPDMEEAVSELYRQDRLEGQEETAETDSYSVPEEAGWEEPPEPEQEHAPGSELAELMSQLDEPEPDTDTTPVGETPEAVALGAESDTEESDTLTELSQEEPITLEAALAAEEGRHRGRLFWTLGSVFLILVTIGQSSWLGRQHLLRYPEGRVLLETVCTVAGCTVPAKRAPQRIVVLRRSMATHLEAENALELDITFVNHAKFAQPLPLLEIILFNLEKKPVVRRRFSPVEYLGREPAKGELLQPGQAMEVEMEIEDPGKDVTGFKLDFF